MTEVFILCCSEGDRPRKAEIVGVYSSLEAAERGASEQEWWPEVMAVEPSEWVLREWYHAEYTLTYFIVRKDVQ